MKQEWKTQVLTIEHLHPFINKLSETAGLQTLHTLSKRINNKNQHTQFKIHSRNKGKKA